MVLPKGAWDPEPVVQRDASLGLLVVEGKLLKSTSLGIVTCAELLGQGDLLRPDDEAGEVATVPFTTRWEVVEKASLAILDRDFAVRIAPWPEIVGSLLARTALRSHHQALHFTSTRVRRLDERLYVLLWHMADRWGYVTPDGVRLPLDLTHEQLARLVGAARPSVTAKVAVLHETGVAIRCSNGPGWLLRGPPL